VSSHPELVARREAFFDAVERELGLPRPSVVTDTRDGEQQVIFFVQWKNYLAGRKPARAIEAANPYALGAWCPPELGEWQVKGSKHMLQADGYSHTEDWDWNLPTNDDPRIERLLHPLAARFGFAFPVPKENWHAEWWVKDGRGGSVILERYDKIPEPDPVVPPPPKEREMPYLIIIGSQPGDAWFAVYPSGLVRHIGGTEAGFYVGDGATVKVPTLVEQDDEAYKGLIGQSGTAWRRS